MSAPTLCWRRCLRSSSPTPLRARRGPAPRPWLRIRGRWLPLQLASKHGLLSFVSTTTQFGTPLDITLSELALETFFPADAATAQRLLRLAAWVPAHLPHP